MNSVEHFQHMAMSLSNQKEQLEMRVRELLAELRVLRDREFTVQQIRAQHHRMLAAILLQLGGRLELHDENVFAVGPHDQIVSRRNIGEGTTIFEIVRKP